MFENDQIAFFEGKFRRFRNCSDCLKNHCAANMEYLTKLNAKGARRSVKMWTTKFYERFFFKNIFYTVHERSSVSSVLYMPMICPGRFFVVESV